MAFILGGTFKISDTRGPIRSKLWRVYWLDPGIMHIFIILCHTFDFRSEVNTDIGIISGFSDFYIIACRNDTDIVWPISDVDFRPEVTK